MQKKENVMGGADKMLRCPYYSIFFGSHQISADLEFDNSGLQ
jgi:hypothetical protein